MCTIRLVSIGDLWVYASVNELKVIVAGVSVASVIVSAVMITLFILGVITGLPRSVLGLIFYFHSSLSVEFGLLCVFVLKPEHPSPEWKNSEGIVIGAGDAGALVVRELQKNRQSNLEPVGFLDDDPGKQHHDLYGVQVLGTLDRIAGSVGKRTISMK